MIDVRSLRVIKKGRAICHVPELTVRPGERLAVIGSNGSGKSTLLRVLAGLERGYQGQCEVRAAPRERTYVHQEPYMLRGSVLSNVAYGLRARGQSRSVATKAALGCLERFGIRELASRRARDLSGGERRRVALARAVVLDPRLMLLDEPLSDLDAEGIESACRVLCALKDTTMLIASPGPLLPELAAQELRLTSPQRA